MHFFETRWENNFYEVDDYIPMSDRLLSQFLDVYYNVGFGGDPYHRHPELNQESQ